MTGITYEKKMNMEKCFLISTTYITFIVQKYSFKYTFEYIPISCASTRKQALFKCGNHIAHLVQVILHNEHMQPGIQNDFIIVCLFSLKTFG